jgi:hypothetical protein
MSWYFSVECFFDETLFECYRFVLQVHVIFILLLKEIINCVDDFLIAVFVVFAPDVFNLFVLVYF